MVSARSAIGSTNINAQVAQTSYHLVTETIGNFLYHRLSEACLIASLQGHRLFACRHSRTRTCCLACVKNHPRVKDLFCCFSVALLKLA
jgi:hypothetical protein